MSKYKTSIEIAAELLEKGLTAQRVSLMEGDPAAAMLANAAATIAVAEQLRLTNIIALANSSHLMLSQQVATDAAVALTDYLEHTNPDIGGWHQLTAHVARLLGIHVPASAEEADDE
jgi:hypothetical protein